MATVRYTGRNQGSFYGLEFSPGQSHEVPDEEARSLERRNLPGWEVDYGPSSYEPEATESNTEPSNTSEEEYERNELVARAHQLGLEPESSLNTEDLREQVEEAEEAEPEDEYENDIGSGGVFSRFNKQAE